MAHHIMHTCLLDLHLSTCSGLALVVAEVFIFCDGLDVNALPPMISRYLNPDNKTISIVSYFSLHSLFFRNSCDRCAESMLDGSSTQIKSISRVFCWTGLRCHSDCGFDAAPDSSIWTYHLSLCLRTDLAFVLPTHSVNVESALLLLFWVFRLLGHVLQLLRTPTATPVFFAS